MLRKLFSAALASAILGATPLPAQTLGQMLRPDAKTPTTRVGTRGANFLEFGAGARAHALGGAVTALIDGGATLYWNTAAAASVPGIQGAFSSAELFEADITHTFASAVLPVGQGAVGASFIYFSSGDIPRTTEDWPSGGDPVAGNTFQWTAAAFGLHYARQITDRLAFGGAVKYAQEGIEQGRASYFGVDLSTRFYTGLYGVTIAAALNNVGSSGRIEGHAVQRGIATAQAQDQFAVTHIVDVSLRTRAVPMPTVFRLGIQTDLIGGAEALIRPDPKNRLALAVDFSDGVDTDLQGAVGLEYAWNQTFFVRGGKRWFNELRAPWEFTDGLSGGFGIRIPALGRKLVFDYAYTAMGELKNVQVFSLEFGY